ncbi:thiol-disulfide oxidoreductase DCC family protein [Candidatus Nitrospira bockiana]
MTPAERPDDPRGEPQPILIYDAECRLCVTAKAELERMSRDTSVKWVPYQSAEAASRLGAHYRPGRPDVAYLVKPDGTIERGLDAFLPLVPGLRAGRWVAALFRVPLLKPLAYLFYRAIARYRYRWFGKVEGGRERCGCRDHGA